MVQRSGEGSSDRSPDVPEPSFAEDPPVKLVVDVVLFLLDGEVVDCDHSLIRSSLVLHAVLNGMVAPDDMARTPCPFPASLRHREMAVSE